MKKAHAAALMVKDRQRMWWQLRGDGEAKPALLSEFLEVEWRFDD